MHTQPRNPRSIYEITAIITFPSSHLPLIDQPTQPRSSRPSSKEAGTSGSSESAGKVRDKGPGYDPMIIIPTNSSPMHIADYPEHVRFQTSSSRGISTNHELSGNRETSKLIIGHETHPRLPLG
ncbi:hypothetical protein WN48_03499 [Eufriesea mexicana]|uniref:Uncharacterized protein n=1 Tax=Eufriesea mexicana TaxID=516756 RepID=A0A310SJ91_9HYME|nr:hypothetical protein WN48_03499 [Eufriesea mexicana]